MTDPGPPGTSTGPAAVLGTGPDTTGSALPRLVRSVGGMASGTLASRVTGFLRVLVMTVALGLGGRLLDSYNVANAIPNAVFDMMFGSLIASVIIPLVTRATLTEPDAGVAYAQRLISLVTYALGLVVALTIVLAPLLVDLYTPGFTAGQRETAVVFARFFLPQVLFYGIAAVAGAVLNARGRFAVPMWAPAVNNVFVVGVGLMYLAVNGSSSIEELSRGQFLLLALGTTAGVVCQMGLVVWAMVRSGFPFRLRLDLRGIELRRMCALGAWVLVAMAANQAMSTVAIRLASTGEPGSVSAYQTAYGLFHVPYAVVAVSVITVALPELSRSASRRDTGGIVAGLSRCLRWAMVVTAPMAAVMGALGPQAASVMFAHGRSTAAAVDLVGVTFSAFGLVLVPFTGLTILTAGFYAMQDTRTPAFITVGVSLIGMAGCVLASRIVPAGSVVVAAPVAYAIAYGAGFAIAGTVLRRRLGRLDGRRVLLVHLKVAVAAVLAGGTAVVTAGAAARLSGTGWPGSAAAVGVGVLLSAVAYTAAARVLHIAELGQLLAVTLRRSAPGHRAEATLPHTDESRSPMAKRPTR